MGKAAFSRQVILALMLLGQDLKMRLPRLARSPNNLRPEEFGSARRLKAEVGRGDDPTVVMLTCWELGAAPDQVSIFARPGEVLYAQNPGGMVPSAEQNERGSVLETVFYGLGHMTVRHLVVCGHTECMTLGMIFGDGSRKQPNPFRDLMQSVKERFRMTYASRPTEEWLGLLVQESVLQQLTNLRSHEEIRTQLEAGELFLHGWVRDDDSAAIHTYDAKTGQFGI